MQNKIVWKKAHELDPEKIYIISVVIPKKEREKTEAIINKCELKFKLAGIKNVAVLPYHISVHQLKK